jgi:hypothetical protein
MRKRTQYITPPPYSFNINIPIKEVCSVSFITNYKILSVKQDEFLKPFAECKINKPEIQWSFLTPKRLFLHTTAQMLTISITAQKYSLLLSIEFNFCSYRSVIITTLH